MYVASDMVSCMRTTVHLPDELLARAKRKAAADGRTLTSLIEEGLRLVLAAKPASKSRARLPISAHRGGLRPDMDVTRLSEIQAEDDLAYAKRLRDGFK
jgi:hypothetical protein